MDLQGYLRSSSLGCSQREFIMCDALCCELLENVFSGKKVLPNLLRELSTWKDAWKLYSSLSHLVHWVFMFTAEGCNTYCAVYLIKRAFLSSGKELGLKWHVFVLVGYETHSGVGSAVWFSSLSRGPSHTCAEWIDGWMCAAGVVWVHGTGCSAV